MSERYGCTDGGCVFGPPEGMHTNGGCRCLRDLDNDGYKRGRVKAGIVQLREERDRLREELNATQEERNEFQQEAVDALGKVEDMEDEIDRMRDGESPRRFEDWGDDDGDVLWWDTSMTEGEIVELPGYVGSPLCQDWPFHDDETSQLYWVTIPRLSRNKPV